MGNKGENIKQEPIFINEKNIYIKGKEQEDMIQHFNLFDILWYAPENSEKLEEYIAFTNVNVYKISDEDQFIYIIKRVLHQFIIIATGSFAEKVIPKLDGKMDLPDIIIYCMDLNHHKEWSKKYKSVSGVFNQPLPIFDKLLKIQNEKYNIPIFSYKIINAKEFNFNYYDNIKNIDLLVNKDNFSLKFNKYEKFCIYVLGKFKLANSKVDNYFEKIIQQIKKIQNFFYGDSNDINPSLDSDFIKNPTYINQAKELINIFTGLIYISLYFSKLPYLYCPFNYKEIEDILKEEVTINNIRKDYKEIHDTHLNYLMGKLINEKVSILEETIHLKFLHSFLIKFIKIYLKDILKLFGYDEYSKYPIIINYLMDIDFCLKLFFFYIYGSFEAKSYRRIYQEILSEVDKRIKIFETYTSLNKFKEIALNYISQEDFNTMNETLKIRDFIVYGNEIFHKMIKKTENYFPHKKIIPYLSSMNKLRDFLKNEKDSKDIKYRNFNYFLIISSEDVENKYKELYSIKNDFALVLSLIVYIKDEITLINKKPFQITSHIPIFIFHNINEMINYINSQENLNFGHNFINQSSSNLETLENLSLETKKNLSPKNEIINIEKVDKLDMEDSWELADSVPNEIFKMAILGSNSGDIAFDKMKINIHNLYTENKAEMGFMRDIVKYFSFQLFPELCYNTINIIIKHFCHAYLQHEDDNSFFNLMNKDLRTKDPKKIEKYLQIISVINKALEDNIVKSYNGKVFRRTCIQNDFMEKNIIKGNILTNLSFWSASKDRKEVEKSLAGKNTLFIIETKKYNIDFEEISKFEYKKEVLFLPFSKYKIKSKEKKLFYNDEFYEVTMEGLNDENERNKIKSLSIPSEFIQYIEDN